MIFIFFGPMVTLVGRQVLRMEFPGLLKFCFRDGVPT